MVTKISNTRKSARVMLLNAVAEHELCPVHRDELIVRGAQELVDQLMKAVDANLTSGGLSGIEELTKKLVRASIVKDAVDGVNDALGELLIDERIGVDL